MKFKVGDKVRVTNVTKKHPWIKPFEGRVCTVKKVFKCANQDVGCYDIGLDYIINEPELEFIKPKFKVGDKVKIIAANHSQDESLIGDIYTVDIAYDDNSYILTDRCKYIWSDDELELVNKFNHKDYSGKYVMHVTTEEQADIFVKYMTDVIGLHWYCNRFRVYKGDTCYNFNEDYYDSKTFYIEENYTILEFEDFDWSDFIMKKEKEFTKADLKNGDVVKCRSGDIGIVCIDTGSIVLKDGCLELSMFTEYLVDRKSNIGNDMTIVAARRPHMPTQCHFSAFECRMGELVYERKEVEEMTLEEVCKALGKEIKIVKK